MRIPNPYANHPDSWLDFDQRAGIAYRVFTSAADVNRFGARYRLAKSFKSIELDGYTAATAQGYQALTKLMLAWGAFEGLLSAIGVSKHQVDAISSRYSYDGMLNELDADDPERRFFAFVHARITSKAQKAEVEKFINKQPCCGITLARAVRHIFVHGPLTPSANQAEPAAVTAVCERLALCLFRVMDREFSDRVKELVEIAPPVLHAPDEDLPF